MKPIKPEYAFWRKRIEGQIRHTMNEYPEWFCAKDKERLVSSMAKRIIGEIVAGTRTGHNAELYANSGVYTSVENGMQLTVCRLPPIVELSTAIGEGQ